MDNDSGALMLLIVLIVSAFLLILIRLAKFVNDFEREKQYLLTEMHRAADYNEYRYWRRELRCLYLCLIPFVTERNVRKNARTVLCTFSPPQCLLSASALSAFAV